MQESLLMVGGNSLSGGPPIGQGDFVGRGDLVDGVRFWGEAPTAGFINGVELASAIRLTAGTAQHTNEPWLHFELDGKTLYVAKKPLRYTVSWDHIHARDAVFGATTVTINGLTYKVRLLTGADVNPTPATSGWDPVGTSSSEWNRLLYKVHNGMHTHTSNETPPGAWPLYSDTDLVVHGSGGNGSASLTQETRASNTGQRVYRGVNGVTYFSFNTSSYTNAVFGWRPALELVLN